MANNELKSNGTAMSGVHQIIVEVSPEIAPDIEAAISRGEYSDAGAIAREALYAWYIKRHGESYLDTALSSDDDEIYRVLGLKSGEVSQIGIENIKEIIYAGKQWWQHNEPKARALVCRQQLVRRVAHAQGDLRDVAEAVCVGLGALYGVEKAAYVAVIIARTGIAIWCKTEWQ